MVRVACYKVSSKLTLSETSDPLKQQAFLAEIQTMKSIGYHERLGFIFCEILIHYSVFSEHDGMRYVEYANSFDK